VQNEKVVVATAGKSSMIAVIAEQTMIFKKIIAFKPIPMAFDFAIWLSQNEKIAIAAVDKYYGIAAICE
jgi:hypothetical protein